MQHPTCSLRWNSLYKKWIAIIDRTIIVLLGLLFLGNLAKGQEHRDFVLVSDSQTASIYVSPGEKPVLSIAAEALSGDIERVAGRKPAVNHDFNKINAAKDYVVIGTLADPYIAQLVKRNGLSDIGEKWEHFLIKVIPGNKKQGRAQILLIIGSDARGATYGVFTLSRLIGVSPWNWWADVQPEKKRRLILSHSLAIEQGPSVQYRGIFLNDEDWGLRPWAARTFDSTLKNIGPKTYAHIFELMLRLKANTIWPAMHPGTAPFFTVKGNKEMARKYDIVIGTSHAEPMLRNNVGEWDSKTMGAFNYLTNSKTINAYWEKRVAQSAGGQDIFTIGLRGVHDSRMEGVKTIEDQKEVLNRVFENQRSLLQKYINPHVAQVPQVFVPYKEVLPVYNAGLKVPEDVTLMWCDDNYGYINRLSNEKERSRSGGSGVYYHLSYWGSPHDYLWLSTTPPGLIKEEMTKAWDHGAREIWIANVGDIKPCAYDMTLFLDLAWDINSVEKPSSHLMQWLAAQFDKGTAARLLPVMAEYYRLATIRKPEFLGNNRVYDKDRAEVMDLPWTESYIRKRLQQYKMLSDRVAQISKSIPVANKAAYFELIQYPVQAAAQMNHKMLLGQLARHGSADWAQSDKAYDSIISLTDRYNHLVNGKWRFMMDCKPRDLPVFGQLEHTLLKSKTPANDSPLLIIPLDKMVRTTSRAVVKSAFIDLLGYNGKALALPKAQQITYAIPPLATDSITVEIRLLPTHAVNGDKLRVEVSLDEDSRVRDFNAIASTEPWRENVLRNQAILRIVFRGSGAAPHTLKIKAVDENIILDEIFLYKN